MEHEPEDQRDGERMDRQGIGIVAASASNLTTVNLPYVARIAQMRVQAGQSVTRGTPLFVVQADPAAVLAATQAKSAVTLAQGELARTQSLYDKGLATQSQLATARKAAEDAQQALAAQNQTGVAGGNKIIAAPTIPLAGESSTVWPSPQSARPCESSLPTSSCQRRSKLMKLRKRPVSGFSACCRKLR